MLVNIPFLENGSGQLLLTLSVQLLVSHFLEPSLPFEMETRGMVIKGPLDETQKKNRTNQQ